MGKPNEESKSMENKIEDFRDHLFETIEKVKSGEMDTKTATAITNASAQIINSAKVEVDFIKAMGGIGEGTGFIPLEPKKPRMKSLRPGDEEQAAPV